MTPEQMKDAIGKLLADNSYELRVAVIDQRNGIDLTEPLAKQWQYVAIVQVVKIAPNDFTAATAKQTP